LIGWLFQAAQRPLAQRVIDSLMACRALLFAGRRYTCPCCGWRLRTFTHGGLSLWPRRHGYCPRCNSKARHRRIWLYLAERTNLLSAPLRLLHVSPKYAFSRRFVRMPQLEYVGVDNMPCPNLTQLVEFTALPFAENTFDAILCIHVLEHVEDDRRAIAELYRVLQPGGWALISVPWRADRETYEDAAIRSPAARREAFGEEQHVRLYGRDLVERLQAPGFQVTLDAADSVDDQQRARYGLLDNENIFFCRKCDG